MINNFLAFLEFNFCMAVVVVGHDSERADYDNRDGSIFGDSYRVKATVVGGPRDGLQFEHAHCFMNDQAGAEALRARIEARVIAGGKLGADCWQEVEPRYGTESWLIWNAEHPETWND
jgi:hypothetical protein